MVLLAPTDYAYLNAIAGIQVRWRLLAVARLRSLSGRNDVAGPHAHEPAHVAARVCQAENHRLGRSVFAAAAIDFQQHIQALRIRISSGVTARGRSDQPGVRFLTFDPLAGSFRSRRTFLEISHHRNILPRAKQPPARRNTLRGPPMTTPS